MIKKSKPICKADCATERKYIKVRDAIDKFVEEAPQKQSTLRADFEKLYNVLFVNLSNKAPLAFIREFQYRIEDINQIVIPYLEKTEGTQAR